MIAQLIALRHGARVLSLTSIMSHPGGTDAVPPTQEALAVLDHAAPDRPGRGDRQRGEGA